VEGHVQSQDPPSGATTQVLRFAGQPPTANGALDHYSSKVVREVMALLLRKIP